MSNVEVLRELARVKAVFQLRAIETIIRGTASCDGRPKDGDAQQAPLATSAAPKADAQTQSPRRPG